MDHVLIIHAVKDYTAWKQVFDNAAPIRKAAGEQFYTLLRDDSDPNTIIHFSRWDSVANAKTFFESPALVEIRRMAGVEAPEFHYLHEFERGNL